MKNIWKTGFVVKERRDNMKQFLLRNNAVAIQQSEKIVVRNAAILHSNYSSPP